MSNLPDEIIFDILSRLPVVSLCRFRCVSKPWRSLISQPHFIRAHLNRSTTNQHERLILHYRGDLYSVDLESSQFGDESAAVPLKSPTEQNLDKYIELCGSCDGLLMTEFCRIDDIYSALINPSTGEFSLLPQSPFGFNPWISFTIYGLGYDSSTDDYKVVSICHYEEAAGNVVSIYALRTNSWKLVEDSPYDHSSFEHQFGVFVNGALHWLAVTGTSDFIVALDLADEKFSIVPSPISVGDNELTVLGGCLGVASKRYNDSHEDIWVMKEYGVRDSWTKFRVSFDRTHDCWKPLSSSRIDRVLFNVKAKQKDKSDKLVLYNLQDKKFKELVVRGHLTNFEAAIYLESLVSLSPNRQC